MKTSWRGRLLEGGVMGVLFLALAVSATAQVPDPDCSQFETVDEELLPDEARLRELVEEVDSFGNRPTASPNEQAYIDHVATQLQGLGVQNVRLDPFELRRWLPTGEVSLTLLEDTEEPVHLAAPIPYSGITPDEGVSGELVYVGGDPSTAEDLDLEGKIMVVDIVPVILPMAVFYANSYYVHDPNLTQTPADLYQRSWVSQQSVKVWQAVANRGGAVGMVVVLATDAALADGSYFPYSGVYKDMPGVYVDRDTGAELKEQITSDSVEGRLVLEATLEMATSRNILGTIPGKSQEAIVLNSHTDGPNAIEDNGPASIVALAEYFLQVPEKCRARTIEIALTSGHMHQGDGAVHFVEEHDEDVLDRTVTAITLEHLGALEWLPDENGVSAPTGFPEMGAVFVSESAPLIEKAIETVRRENMERTFVMHAFLPLPGEGGGPPYLSFPGEAHYLNASGVPIFEYITGPTYLLNATPTLDKIDFGLMHREVRGFAQLVTDLFTIPKDELLGATPAYRAMHENGLR